jgi:hypothetical protein
MQGSADWGPRMRVSGAEWTLSDHEKTPPALGGVFGFNGLNR